MNLARKSRFLEYVLVYLDTALWTSLVVSVLLSVLLAQPSVPAVLLMEPGNPTHSVREIQERHRMAATPVLDLMVGLEIEQLKLEVVHHVVAIMEALKLAIEIVEAIIGRLQQVVIIENLEEVAIGKTIEEVAIGKLMVEVHQEEMVAMETRMEGRETMGMVVLNPSKTTVHHQNSNHEATQASVLTRTAMVEAAEVRVVGEEEGVLEKFWKPVLMCVLDFLPECFLLVLQVVPEDVLVGNRIPGSVMSKSKSWKK